MPPHPVQTLDRALILAGGTGSRLRPFTYTRAKQLVPLANKPVLFWVIEQLVEAGVRQLGIVVGDTEDQIRAAVGDGSSFGPDLSVRYLRQDAPRGIAHAISLGEELAAGEPFLVVLGDNFVRGGIRRHVERFAASGAAAGVLLAEVPDASAFGVAELRDGRLVRVVEKPAQPPSRLAVTGIYYFTPLVFEVIAGLRPSARGEYEVSDAISGLIERGEEVAYGVLDDAWIDTGKREDILEANRLVLEQLRRDVRGSVDADSTLSGAVVVSEGATIERSVVKGPAVIGPGCRLEEAYVGSFTSVDRDCLLRRVEISHSMVLDGCRLEDVHGRIEDSLIGRNVTLTNSQLRPRALKLALGDFSVVRVP
jgi:glucose-1-phosphate thymidylyltransferase